MANTIKVTSCYIEIYADPSDTVFTSCTENVKGIFAERRRNTYRCSLRRLPEVLFYMRGIADEEPLTGSIREYYVEEMQRRSFSEELKTQPFIPDPDSWLWPHQQLGVKLAEYNRRYNFFYDTRTGKTLMAYQIMYNALKEGRVKRCLVLTPASIIGDWLRDAADKFPMLKVVAYYGDDKQKQIALNTPAHVVLWSEGMFLDNVEQLKQCKFDMCFFDESSKLKSYKSKVSECALEYSITVPSWYNLSATPAPNGKQEYYVQMRTVDPYSLNPTRGHFVAKYFDNTSRNNNYEKLVIKPEMEKEFMKLVEEYSIYVDQSVMPSAGKAPPHIVEFEQGPEVIQAYKTMASDMYAEVEGITLTAEQSASMRNKLNQIASGFILHTEAIKNNQDVRRIKIGDVMQEAYRMSDDKRIDTLNTLLTYLGPTKVVIWANYQEEFKMLQELLGIRAMYVRGGSSTTEKLEAIKAFRETPLQYLVAHPLSLGMGINLTVAHNAIYYSLNDSWEAFKQSSERIFGHISVQPHMCHYWILMAKNTVNDVIYTNVTTKRDASTGFLDHLKAVALQ
jgi:SNF2 family DNA or RNA helicase